MPLQTDLPSTSSEPGNKDKSILHVLTEARRRKPNRKNNYYAIDLQQEACNEEGEERQGTMKGGGRLKSYQFFEVELSKIFIQAGKQLSPADYRALLKSKSAQIREILETLQPPSLPQPDPSGKSYAVFVPRTGMDAFEHLRSQWGAWLKCFNEDRPVGEALDRDYLYQDQLSELDPRLIPALSSQFQRLNATRSKASAKRVRDFIPPKESRPKPCTCEFS